MAASRPECAGVGRRGDFGPGVRGAHVYQGLAGTLKAAAAGMSLAAAYLLTGSPRAPIVLHAMVDVTSLLTSSIARAGGEPVSTSRG